MREHMRRLSFDIPESEHVLLKAACAYLRIAMKDFAHEALKKALEDIQEKQLHERLNLAFHQVYEGKVKSLGSFAKYVEDEI